MRFFLAALLLLLSSSFAALAQDGAGAVTFQWPVRCEPGLTCWVMNYVDHTPDSDGKGVDTTCAARTYDGHKGTDIMVKNERAMKTGMDVLAARDGKILRIRDGEEDRFPTDDDLAKTRAANKDCGNAVLIDHGNGWQAIYCHLKKNSIVVKPGDAVKAGDKIAAVGLSGYTQFPHLHFGLTHNGKVMDPFSGIGADEDCSHTGISLWSPADNIHYEDIAMTDVAFTAAPPTLDTLDHGVAPLVTLSAKEAGALVYYALINGVQSGDIISLSITAPDGSPFARREIIQDKTRARQLLFVGRRTDQIQLIPGTYKGKLVVRRKDKTWQKETNISITP